ALGYSGLHQRSFVMSLSPGNQTMLAEITRMQTMEHDARVDDAPCRFFIARYDAATDARMAECHARHGPALVVFGDSHAIDAYKGLIANSVYPFLIGAPQKACRPHIAGSDCRESGLPRFLAAHGGRIDLAVYVQAGFWLMTDADGGERARALFSMGGDLDPRLNGPAIERTFEVLDRFGAMVPLVWLGPWIEPHIEEEEMLASDCGAVSETLSLNPAQIAIFHDLDRDLAQRAGEAEIAYLSAVDTIAFDPATELYTCETLYWSDGDHWSPAGEALFGARIAPVIEERLSAATSG
ncbi:MAG: hypothetical protein AAF317_08365, partial [Pseudomonadota bacterium]